MCLSIRRIAGVAAALWACAAMAQTPGMGADSYSIMRPGFTEDPKVGIPIPTEAKALLERFHKAHQTSIQLAKLALQKTRSPLIHSYAEMIIRNHEAGDEAVLTDANRLNLTLVEPEAVNEAENAIWTSQLDAISEMQGLHGRAFDEIFLANMLQIQDVTLGLASGAQKQRQFRKTIIEGTIVTLLPTFQQDRERAYQLLGTTISNLG